MTPLNTPTKPQIRLVINMVVALILVGVVLWMINMWIPMAGSIKAILNIVVVTATCILIMQAIGIWPHIVRLWNSLLDRAQHPRP